MFLGFNNKNKGGSGSGGGGGGPSSTSSSSSSSSSSTLVDHAMLASIDKEFPVLHKQCLEYERSIANLQGKIEANMQHFREAAQSLCAIGEGLALGGGLDGRRMSGEACDFLNATNLVATEAINDFEEALRQHVLSSMEYIQTENRRIEARMQARGELLRQHDAAFRDMVRTNATAATTATTATTASSDASNNSSSKEAQDAQVAKLRREFFAMQDQLKTELRALLRERVQLYRTMLAKLSAIQLRLFAKMYNALGKSVGFQVEVPPAVAASEELGNSKGEGDAGEEKEQGTRAPTKPAVVATPLDQALVEAVVQKVTQGMVEEIVARTEAVALVERQVTEEEQAKLARTGSNPALNNLRRLPSFFTSRRGPPSILSPPPSSPHQPQPEEQAQAPEPVASPVLVASSATGAGVVLSEDSLGGGGGGPTVSSSKFNMDMFKKLIPRPGGGGGGGGGGGDGSNTNTNSSNDTGKKPTGRPDGPASPPPPALADITDSKEGWLRLEQDFQASLMKAALKASSSSQGREQQPQVDWMGRGGDAALSPGSEARRGYLASLGQFKAFHMPFTLIGKALDSPTKPSAEASSTNSAGPTQQWVDWSLKKDADKYTMSSKLEDMATLRTFLPLPSPCTTDATPATAPAAPVGDETKQPQCWLGASLRYLDVVDLAQASSVCQAWQRVLMVEERGRKAWKQAVRQGGVPDTVRARFWHYLLYATDIPWRPSSKNATSSSSSSPSRSRGVSNAAALSPHKRGEGTTTVYQGLVARAQEQIRHYQKTGRMVVGTGSSVFGVALPPESVDLDADWENEAHREAPGQPHPHAAAAATATDDFGQRRSNWISEIEADVQRTYVIRHRGFDELDLRKNLSDACFPTAGGTEEEKEDRPVPPQDDADDDATTAEEVRIREVQRARLSRVLQAFAIYAPHLRYCQGMNMCAAVLLKVTHNEEEAAFWLLVGMAERCQMDEMWVEGMARLKACFTVLTRLLQLRLPALHAHFDDVGVHVAMFSSKWFVTLFSNLDTLPLETVLRVWDVFFLEGWAVIFGVAVSLIEMLEGQLRGLELEDVLRVMQDPRRALRELFVADEEEEEEEEEEKEEGGDACCCADAADGITGNGTPHASISTVLLRRGSALAQGEQVLQGVERDYHLEG